MSISARAPFWLTSLVALKISVAAILTAKQFPGSSLDTDVGSGFFPMMYCLVLIALALSLACHKGNPEQNSVSESETSRWSAQKIALLLGFLLLYALLPLWYAIAFILIATPFICLPVSKAHFAAAIGLIKNSATAPVESDEPLTEQPPSHLRVALGMLCLALYIISIKWLGFALPTIPFLFCIMWLLGFRHRYLAPILAIGITALIYSVFVYGLRVQLPIGEWVELVLYR